MLQRLLMALSVGAALAVLALLVIRTQGQPQSVQGHLARMTALAQLSAADAEADTEVARARLSLEADPPGLADAEQHLESARAALALHRDGLRAVSREVGSALSTLLQQVDEKQALLNSYRKELNQFAPAYAQLRRQAEALLAEPALPPDSPARGHVRRLIEEVTAYSLQSAPTNETTIAQLIALLTTDAAALPSLRPRLLALRNGAGNVLGGKDQVKALAGQLAALPVSETLVRLKHAYTAHYTQAEGELARYRLLLAIYATALLAVFGFMGWRLRRSYGELDRSHAELQNLNAHLEETVEARTAELRKALEDLRFQQAQLIQSEKMAALGQMVAGVAHEINTPLGYARGNVETVKESLPYIRELIDAHHAGDAERQQQALQRWQPDEGFQELELLLNDADYGLGQISELVLGLKDFSRVDRSLSERFDLNDGIETSLKICQSHLKNRITVERDYGEVPAVPCAPSQINQVFLNLITNAAQAIDGEGTIALRTYVEDDAAVVEVRDSGCGMDAETQAHIFEPFFTTKPVGQGTGLGLSIVFRIIEDHRGLIEVDSAPGVGTTFRLRLPLQTAAEASAMAEPSVAAPALQEAYA